MDILSLVDRAARAERNAAEIYDHVAIRMPQDRAFWMELAEDERRHAKNLVEWRRLLEREPPERRPIPNGYDALIEDVERVLDDSRKRTETITDSDQAFAIALEIESSEIDTIYTELLQCSPLSRYPDLGLTRARELDRHHRKLVAAIRGRATDEALQFRADLLELER